MTASSFRTMIHDWLPCAIQGRPSLRRCGSHLSSWLTTFHNLADLWQNHHSVDLLECGPVPAMSRISDTQPASRSRSPEGRVLTNAKETVSEVDLRKVATKPQSVDA